MAPTPSKTLQFPFAFNLKRLVTIIILICSAAQSFAWTPYYIGGVYYAVPRNYLEPGQWDIQGHHTWDCRDSCEVIFDDRVNVLFLRYKWSMLNPSKGVYDFSDLGHVIDSVSRSGKRVSLVVMAGKYTPEWVFQSGVPHLSIPALTFGDSFSQPLIPATWNSDYLKYYGQMITALGDFLRENPHLYEAVVLVKNGALVINSEETRMMPVDAFFLRSDTAGSLERQMGVICDAWASLGYTEEKILTVARETSAQIVKTFPEKFIGLAFVSGSNRFPSIDSNGKCLPLKQNATLKTIVEQFVDQYRDRSVVNDTTLAGGGIGQPKIFAWVKKQGGQIAFQLNARKVGCRSPNYQCFTSEFVLAMREGMDEGAVFIEVHDGNIVHYADLLRKMNKEMADIR